MSTSLLLNLIPTDRVVRTQHRGEFNERDVGTKGGIVKQFLVQTSHYRYFNIDENS